MASVHQEEPGAAVARGRGEGGPSLALVVPVSPSDEGSQYADAPSASSASQHSPETSPTVSNPGAPRGSKPGRTPSRYDWSKHKATIRRLYMDEDKTLREVLEIMEREHNFVATPRMVKTRLKKWGYSKNVSIKSEEVESLMELIFDAESHGDVRQTSTEVTLATGRVVGLDRVAAHLRRKRIPSSVVQKASHLSTLARYQHGRPPSPRATAIDAPAVFRVSESILTDLHSYVYAHAGSPLRDNLVALDYEQNGQDRSVYDLVISARRFITQDRMAEASALLRKAPARIKSLLDSNLVTIPRCLFLLFIHLLSMQGSPQLTRTTEALVRYVAALASDPSLDWPQGHPLRRVLFNLSQADGENLLDVLIQGYKCILLSFESLPDASARGRTIPAWLDLGDAAGFETLPVESLESSLWKDCQDRLSSGAEPQKPPIQQMFWMAELERQKVKARGISSERLKELFRMTLDTCEGEDTPIALLAELNCNYYLAGIYQAEGQRSLAESHMRKSIEQCNLRGETSSAARLMTELQGWLRDWGEQEKVEKMQHEITDQLSNLGLDVTPPPG